MEHDFDSELVIGLVSAVGTETKRGIDLLKERLGLAGYRVHEIKVSRDVIPRLCQVEDHGRDEYLRISGLMDAGNKARESSGDDSILASGAAAAVFAMRNTTPGEASPKTAYIIDSLKRPEEVAKLRLIYPFGFVLIGIHADEKRRKNHLITDRGIAPENAHTLIHRDGDEGAVKRGQRVKTFHMADFFVRISQSQDQLRGDVIRMVSLWFGDPYITPTFDEPMTAPRRAVGCITLCAMRRPAASKIIRMAATTPVRPATPTGPSSCASLKRS